jgi:hypothetical protein
MERIHYEPHPVTPERKAELRAQGLKIIDAVFAPEGHEPQPAPARRGRKPKHDGDESADAQEL